MAHARTVVCGIDGSASSLSAFRVASKLAEKLELPLVAVYVLEGGDGETDLRAAGEILATTIRDIHHTNGVQPVIEVGHPAERLVEATRQHEAALLVVGSNGVRSSATKSVSAQTTLKAPCPVVVVPPGTDECLDREPRSTTAMEGGILRFRF